MSSSDEERRIVLVLNRNEEVDAQSISADPFITARWATELNHLEVGVQALSDRLINEGVASPSEAHSRTEPFLKRINSLRTKFGVSHDILDSLLNDRDEVSVEEKKEESIRERSTTPSHEVKVKRSAWSVQMLSPKSVREDGRTLEEHKKIQEELLSEISGMTEALKMRSKTIGQQIQEDNTLLDDTEKETMTNINRTEGGNVKLRETHRTSLWQTCTFLFVVLAAFVLFLFSYSFMKSFPRRR